jgi:hypothetical protein
MRGLSRSVRDVFRLPVMLAVLIVTPACATHRHYYRSYDPYYNDYHVWGPSEDRYYQQWVIETRRRHRGYRKLKRHEQREYWEWRHRHNDHRGDRDRR